jgi:hypothetical protein
MGGGQADLRCGVGSTAGLVVGPKRSSSGIRRINFIAAMALIYCNAQLLGVFDRPVRIDLVT